jgi:uncharacterized tellurite resistance protein B-like protein
MMTSAVYFPYIHPEVPLLKRALLTWDQVEVFTDSSYRCRHLEGEFLEAWELVCRPRSFSATEYDELHRRLRQTVKTGIPDDLYIDQKKFDDWHIARGLPPVRLKAQGVDEKTANVLIELGLGVRDKDGDVFGGFKMASTVVALQAEIVAGATKQQITDDKATYSAYCDLIAGGRAADGDLPSSGEETLLSVALESVGLRNITLRQLIEYRKRELKEPELGTLRRKFAENLAKFLSDISKNKTLTRADWEELQRMYRIQVDDDIRILSREMGCETSAFVLSKAFLAPMLTGVSTLASLLLAHVHPAIAAIGTLATMTTSEAVITVAEVLAEGRKTINSQAKILESHPLAYIYELSEKA